MTMPRVPTHVVRRLAVAGDVDPRTIRKLLRGENVRGVAAERGRDAIREAGIELTQEEERHGDLRK